MGFNLFKISSGKRKQKVQADAAPKLQKPKNKNKKTSKPISKSDVQELAEDNYQLITEKIKKAAKNNKCFLFASCNSAAMPITIPVNVAIQMASEGKRCLLIDMDLRRDALAHVFEISNNPTSCHPQPKALKTSFENLFIWPARNFSETGQMNLHGILESAHQEMDFVFISAPTLTSCIDRKLIANTAKCCILFSSNTDELDKLKTLFKDSPCNIIGNMRLIFKRPQSSDAGTVDADYPKTTA